MSSPSPTRTQRAPTFAILALLDLTIYFDWAMRWEKSFAFVYRTSWLSWTSASLLGWLLVTGWLVRDGAGFWRQAILTFLAFSVGMFVASMGNPHYDFRRLPVAAGLFEEDNLTFY